MLLVEELERREAQNGVWRGVVWRNVSLCGVMGRGVVT